MQENIRKKIGLVCGEKKLSYGELNERVNRLARALLKMGAGRGDRMAIRAKNCSQYVEFFFAAAKCGAVAVPINPALKEQEFSYMIRDSGSSILFIHDTDIPFCRSLSLPALGIKHVICLERGEEGFLDYEQLLSQAGPEEIAVVVEEKDPAMIVYTSGTTGAPKGVTLTHRNCVADIHHILIEQLVEFHHVILLPFPLFHTAAISSVFKTFYVAARLVLTTSTNPADLIRTIEREKVTSLNIVPTLLNAVCNAPEIKTCDISSVRSGCLWRVVHADGAAEKGAGDLQV